MLPGVDHYHGGSRHLWAIGGTDTERAKTVSWDARACGIALDTPLSTLDAPIAATLAKAHHYRPAGRGGTCRGQASGPVRITVDFAPDPSIQRKPYGTCMAICYTTSI